MALPMNYRMVSQTSNNLTPGKTYAGNSQGSPFVHNDNSSPSFSPVKLGSRPVVLHSVKPPKPPEKPLMPYMRYSKKVWDSVKAKHPDLKLWEIGKIVGSMWREVSDEEKQELVEEWEAEKADYGIALKAYHQSPEYQNYLREKKNATLDRDPDGPSTPHSKTHQNTTSTKSSASGSAGGDFPKVALIPAADDDDDLSDGFSEKHLAAARYTRNHLLIHEIFSDVMVPDARSVVTSARMNVLKRQVQSLSMHQEKLEKELQQLEEKHESKKRKFLDAAEKFNDDYSNQCDFRVTKEQCEEFYKKHCETIKQQLANKGKLPAGSSGAAGAGASSSAPPSSTAPAAAPATTSAPSTAAPGAPSTTNTSTTSIPASQTTGVAPSAAEVTPSGTPPTTNNGAPAAGAAETESKTGPSGDSPAATVASSASVPVAQPLTASSGAPKS